jgi:hypothetical protein
LDGINKATKARIRVGVCQNDDVFNNANCAQFLQAIHKATHWISLWSFVLSEEQWEHMDLDALA